MKTILVVDDDSANLIAAKNALDEIYKVILVSSGIQAIKYLQGNDCDLVLLDVDMPDMDGIETLRKIRLMEKGRRLPVIFLTANRFKETVLEGSKLGIMDYITKPFNRDRLRERIIEIFKQINQMSITDSLLPQLSNVIVELKNNLIDIAITELEDIVKRLREELGNT